MSERKAQLSLGTWIKKISSILKYNDTLPVCLCKMSGMATTNMQMAAEQKRNITQVINDYSKRLKGFIRKRVTNEADAEDILQDVFYQLIGNTQPIEQLTAWLFTVTRNKITDRQRKQKPELIEDIYTNAEGEDSINWTEFFPTQMETPNRNTSEAYSGKPSTMHWTNYRKNKNACSYLTNWKASLLK